MSEPEQFKGGGGGDLSALGRWCSRALYWQPVGSRANSLISNSYSRFWNSFLAL